MQRSDTSCTFRLARSLRVLYHSAPAILANHSLFYGENVKYFDKLETSFERN